jgi:hypothetical protein
VGLLRDTGVQVDGTIYRLNSSSVHLHSGDQTTLLGASMNQAALDWFFSGLGDVVQNRKRGEVVTAIH